MRRFRAAVFDVDGVLVDSPHEEAWRQSLRELMESQWAEIRPQTTWSSEAFTPLVYQQHVSGKPRMSGARSALQYFGVSDLDRRTSEYAARKQEMVVRLIEAGAFTAYPDALRFTSAVKDGGLLLAAASSSKNAALLLRNITVRHGVSLMDLFDADVSGRDFAHGKPHPEMFLTAAEELGAEPDEVVVVEDAVAGIQAAKAGGMASIGVARAGDARLLEAAGADLVVSSLDAVDTGALPTGLLAGRGTR